MSGNPYKNNTDEYTRTLEYKGKTVFVKKHMRSFKRLVREYIKNEACFAFVTRGSARVRDQSNLLGVDTDTALLAKCTNYFYESSRYPDQSEDNIEAIGIFLYPDVFQGMLIFDITKSKHTTDYNLKQIEVDQLLGHFRDSVNILLESPELADELLIENKLREFVLLMTKKVGAPSEVDFLASMFKPYFARFEEVIQNNLYADLSLEELAKLCHMSLSTFKRKFAKIYSETPKKYITRLKIDKAIYLLKSKDLRVSDIVYQTGFESISTFNRAFKAQTGKSPSEYRLN